MDKKKEGHFTKESQHSTLIISNFFQVLKRFQDYSARKSENPEIYEYGTPENNQLSTVKKQ